MSRIKEVLDGFNTTVKIVKKKNPDKSKLYIAFDLFVNMLIYPISFPDYRKCNYINLTKEEKKQCITKEEYKRFVYYMDDEKYRNVFLDKSIFDKTFKDFIGRDYIDLRECSLDEFKSFIQGKQSVFAKVLDEFGGHGISKIKDFSNPEQLYETLKENKQFLIEDTIVQHDELNRINPYAVNNVRFSTVVKDGQVYVVTRTLRLNTGNDPVISSNDVMVNVDEEGNLISDAIDEMFETYEKHPDTNAQIKGTKLPFIKEAEEMVKKAALRVPQVRYVGWDVGITPNGPLLIEGNFYPSYGLTQFYLLNPDYPLKRRLKAIMKEEYDLIEKK
ncbi:MAG: hypothetical protein IJ220_06830 [Clostridia bacterium]|nr:hypothetical protein [Clostridia bacterium]